MIVKFWRICNLLSLRVLAIARRSNPHPFRHCEAWRSHNEAIYKIKSESHHIRLCEGFCKKPEAIYLFGLLHFIRNDKQKTNHLCKIRHIPVIARLAVRQVVAIYFIFLILFGLLHFVRNDERIWIASLRSQ